MSTAADRVDEAVALARSEILDDVRHGHVPADVPTFAALHDHVDANMYGDLDGDDIDHANAVQEALHRWIVAGGIRAAEHARANPNGDTSDTGAADRERFLR